MVWSRTLLGCAAALALLSASARGADMPDYPPEPPSLPPHEGPPVIESFGGWYLRGDIGYAWGISPDAESAAPFLSPVENKLGNDFVGGVGFGYKSKWLRTDVTIDYTAPLKNTGVIAAPDDTTAKLEAITALINGYVDLGTWYRTTPYVGLGAGVSQLRTFDYASTAAPPFTPGLSHTQWNFTWAAIGGVGFAIAPNLTLDLSYRYMNFGDVTTAGDAFGAMSLKRLAAHEVRIGIRWYFDDQPYSD